MGRSTGKQLLLVKKPITLVANAQFRLSYLGSHVVNGRRDWDMGGIRSASDILFAIRDTVWSNRVLRVSNLLAGPHERTSSLALLKRCLTTTEESTLHNFGVAPSEVARMGGIAHSIIANQPFFKRAEFVRFCKRI